MFAHGLPLNTLKETTVDLSCLSRAKGSTVWVLHHSQAIDSSTYWIPAWMQQLGAGPSDWNLDPSTALEHLLCNQCLKPNCFFENQTLLLNHGLPSILGKALPEPFAQLVDIEMLIVLTTKSTMLSKDWCAYLLWRCSRRTCWEMGQALPAPTPWDCWYLPPLPTCWPDAKVDRWTGGCLIENQTIMFCSKTFLEQDASIDRVICTFAKIGMCLNEWL